MRDFTEKMVTGHGTFEVAFKRNAEADGVECFVYVTEDDYSAPPFIMRRVNGVWKIPDTNQVSPWLLQLECALGKAIAKTAIQHFFTPPSYSDE